jgi:hypothetical protein
MAYLYASSKTWRRIVDATSRSSGYMLVFAGACVALPYFLGDQARLQHCTQCPPPAVSCGGAVLCHSPLLALLSSLPARQPAHLPAAACPPSPPPPAGHAANQRGRLPAGK